MDCSKRVGALHLVKYATKSLRWQSVCWISQCDELLLSPSNHVDQIQLKLEMESWYCRVYLELQVAKVRKDQVQIVRRDQILWMMV